MKTRNESLVCLVFRICGVECATDSTFGRFGGPMGVFREKVKILRRCKNRFLQHPVDLHPLCQEEVAIHFSF